MNIELNTGTKQQTLKTDKQGDDPEVFVKWHYAVTYALW